MSSNAFLNVIDYRCRMIGNPLQSADWWTSAVVRVASDGGWYLYSSHGTERMLLLRNRSLWWPVFAVLTVVVSGRRRCRLWLFRDAAKLTSWRRISVRYNLT